ncbi:NAD(P)-binding protein [Violaceomyces palustris]|uniref:NAD(P)-binding protein n=1 Tax=Violaceomyces palustris TaxID=1673888 RepID=A0ACD0P883_9BASI|nr:NAD(P)-binding protein [Violaceomyces palustris]
MASHKSHRSEETLTPPPHPTPQQIAEAPRRHHLFGYPISHSASPAFHNFILQSLAPIPSQSSSSTSYPTYSLKDTMTIQDPHFRQMVRDDPLFAGSSVTMPLKVAIAAQLGEEHILDELSPSGKATQTVNTIVVLPPNASSKGKRRMLGTNTDYLGIAHALLRSCATQNGEPSPSSYIDPKPIQSGDVTSTTSYRFPRNADGKTYSAFIIGSGGTCRSAVYALHQLGLSPLYLLNRDKSETDAVIDHFGDTIDLRPLRSIEEYEREKSLREKGEIGHVAAAVGAIPAFEPRTEEEKMVYKLAHSFFAEPYKAFDEKHVSPVENDPTVLSLPLPAKRPFLDMCYKPRLTPLLVEAGKKGWDAIGGVEAMVEQGLAQARMWAASAKILSSGQDSDEDPSEYATKAGDEGPLGAEIEEKARRLVSGMMDIVVTTPATSAATTVSKPPNVVETTVEKGFKNSSQAQPVH